MDLDVEIPEARQDIRYLAARFSELAATLAAAAQDPDPASAAKVLRGVTDRANNSVHSLNAIAQFFEDLP